MSTESTGAAEPGAAPAVPSEPPAAVPPAPAGPPAVTEAPSTGGAADVADAPSDIPATEPTEPTEPDGPAGLVAEASDVEGFIRIETLAAGEEPARPKRKLGVGAMFLIAVLAGPVIGAVVGYGIQAARPATPLPELVAPKLSYSAERIDAKALAAAGPQPLNIDGDLRDLLIKRPDGAKEMLEGEGDGWMSVADQAETYGDSAQAFGDLLRSGFRRQAVVAWYADDNTQYWVNLHQFTSESADQTILAMSPYSSGKETSKIPGNDDSLVLISKEPTTYARSTEQYYWGEALARKGTVLMSVSVQSKNPVDRAQLEDIAKRQWERLA
ncbi:hypothetical protein ACIQF6_29865 [Kitasatospora sp. NPDC092948]|uniref:hypothetical protein n=1 Tax=Kitasatospora sp. NPDC092948 TaxID=3364088 RepID=UPI00380A7BF0